MAGIIDVLGALPDPFGLNPAAPKRIATALSSSWLTAMDWEPETQELTVTMRGQPYVHYNVPEAIAMGLRDADSPGRYWHGVLKDVF